MKKTLAIAALMLPLLAVETASAGSCANAVRSLQQSIFKNLGDVCAQVNTGPKENSPFIYVNPDGGCDLGLELPGLPTFGASMGGGFDMCGFAKTVTGGMVNQANSAIRNAMNDTVNGINQKTQETIGTPLVNNQTDVMDLINQSAQNAGTQAGNGQTPNFAP